MNPYLEQDDAWHDFHERFLPLVADLLVAQVRPGYIVKIDEHVQLDLERLAFVEIRDRRNRELVTVVELLSPSNKRPGADREQYLAKREQVLGSSAHLVEIDLLRGGKPLPLANRPDCAYSVLLSRVEDRPRAGFWPVGLRSQLPVIPVPLRAPDADARLDLQAIVHRLYDSAGYEDYIYDGVPDPPLAPDDLAWSRALLP
jgi:hypothetical protein